MKKLFTILTLLFAPIILCLGLPLLIAVGGINASSTPPSSKALPKPPEQAIEIVGADHLTVYVRTTSGKFVRCATIQLSACWEPTTKPSTMILVSNVDERQSTSAPVVPPPGQAVSTIGVNYQYSGGFPNYIYFAVLSDGSVWYLPKDTTADNLTFVSLIALPALLTIAGAGMVVVYIIEVLIFLPRLRKKQ